MDDAESEQDGSHEPRNRLLEHPEILSLHAAAVSAGLTEKRSGLLVGIDKSITGGLPLAQSPNEQVLCDLDGLNGIGYLDDRTVPLETWLATAAQLAGSRVEASTFRDMLKRVRGIRQARENSKSHATVSKLQRSERWLKVKSTGVPVVKFERDIPHALVVTELTIVSLSRFVEQHFESMQIDVEFDDGIKQKSGEPDGFVSLFKGHSSKILALSMVGMIGYERRLSIELRAKWPRCAKYELTVNSSEVDAEHPVLTQLKGIFLEAKPWYSRFACFSANKVLILVGLPSVANLIMQQIAPGLWAPLRPALGLVFGWPAVVVQLVCVWLAVMQYRVWPIITFANRAPK
jgi:hypothetical protein